MRQLRLLVTDDWILLCRCARQINFRFWTLAPAAVLSFASSALEGALVIVLIPIIQLFFQGQLPPDSTLGAILQQLPLERLGIGPKAFLLCLLAFIALAKCGAKYCADIWVNRSVRHFWHRLRVHLYARYLSFGKLFFDQNSMGHLHQVLATHTLVVATTLSVLFNLLVSGSLLLTYLVILVTISPLLTSFLVLVLPLSNFCLSKVIRSIKSTSLQLADSQSSLAKQLTNALSCIPLVKAYTAEADDLRAFTQISAKAAMLQGRIDRRTLALPTLTELISLLHLLTVLAFITLFLTPSASDMAYYSAYLLTLRRASGLFNILSSFQSALASISGPLSQVSEMFDDQGKFFVQDGTLEHTGRFDELELRGLTYTYPTGSLALHNLNFTFRRGTVTAIVGHTGSGKSTLINLLLRFYDPPVGTIYVDGRDVRDYTLRSWRAMIAVVSQDAWIMNGSLRANLTFGIHHQVSDSAIRQALQFAQLDDFVFNLPQGLDTEIGDRGVRLSGGERQRLSIARALLKDADILILDEATSALDSRTERMIQNTLDEIARGRTTIVIAHRLSTIKNADTVIVLEDGEIKEHGSIDSLLRTEGQFFSYWREQRME